MRKAIQATLLMATVMFFGSASGQVYKCPAGPSGRITYSDTPCTDGRQIERARSAEEVMLDRERASIAREREQLSRERQQLREMAENRPQQVQPTPNRADSYECRQALKKVERFDGGVSQQRANLACMNSGDAAAAQAAAQAERAARRPFLTNCTTVYGQTSCISR